MRTTYIVKPESDAMIDQIARATVKVKRGRHPALPGAEVVAHYASGRPKTYRYRHRNYSLRQYGRLVRTLREQGVIEPQSRAS